MNVWLTRRRNKRYTFEISKNAIFRFGPLEVKLVDKNENLRRIIVDVGPEKHIDMQNLIYIRGMLPIDNYRATLRTFDKSRDTFTNALVMKITNMEIDVVQKHVHLTVDY